MTIDLLVSRFLSELNIHGLPESWFGPELVLSQANDISDLSKSSLVDKRSEMSFLELEKEALECELCSLCQNRKSVVFGDGNIESPLIAFVGEGPGADEDLQGLPFVGKAGELLNNAIEKGLGLKRKDIYICNVVKCRPPENRTPLPNEVQACSPYLYRQLELIKPKVIVTLGQTAQQAISAKEIGITKLRGQWQEWRGVPVMPTYHPAYILRNPEAKKPFWEDLKEVMKFLGI